MKIKWLNNERTLARLSRGFLFWRRVAVVERIGYEKWRYVATGEMTEDWVSRAVDWRAIKDQVAQEQADKERRNWTRSKLPPARLMGRKP